MVFIAKYCIRNSEDLRFQVEDQMEQAVTRRIKASPHLLLLEFEKVIGKLETETEVRIQKDHQNNIENTTFRANFEQK